MKLKPLRHVYSIQKQKSYPGFHILVRVQLANARLVLLAFGRQAALERRLYKIRQAES